MDAGKTSLTERLLHFAGVVDELGSVDAGSTHTDSLALERRRGITIKSAVVSFALDGRTVNLIDTPGHPDFIAEVERVLGVLDGAVLVVSAVEGVQAQTRVLMRTLRRLRIPTLIFVNKIDRRGAEETGLLRSLGERLTPALAPLGAVRDAGLPTASFHPYADGDGDTDGDTDADTAFADRLGQCLAEQDDTVLAAYLDALPHPLPSTRLRQELVRQTRQARIHPVFFGSAATGAGIDALAQGIRELLPRAGGDPEGPVSGTVFKVERGESGQRTAYVRLFDGTVRVRDHVTLRQGRGETREGRVTGVRVFTEGTCARSDTVPAGRIGQLLGLVDVRVGDTVGESGPRTTAGQNFAPPTLETVVAPVRPGDRRALHTALVQLAEQDPLIGLRHDEIRREVSVSLYGEVQKEVIATTLAEEYAIPVSFSATTTLHEERVSGCGQAHEMRGEGGNPFVATVGLRVEPGPEGSGVDYRLGVELGSMPHAFLRAVEDTVRRTLQQGLYGWQVSDCAVTLTHSGFCSVTSTAADFRRLTPLVLMTALRSATTTVHEPVHEFRLEVPAGALGQILPLLARLRAVPAPPRIERYGCLLTGEIPAASVDVLERGLPGLTGGEGLWESSFARHRPVPGARRPPARPRTDHNPLHREEYLLHVLRRV
ncbi:TetM/TetW/TetO/TetS family tetracycline resistance ribosomal protection protein [Streptomyces sp. NBC_00237]|uniref:elongation factor G n=1 Tax=Streptomyces sp. NBC_00237 TaxID=2975687 RepID=UPI0022550D9C|nr:TetM/TetW/TetO/TetS family tetracycline resistance ribosomal protection protein [Streptomyces sp. NBC_00237]MCX5205431.1 TetM/TetW/TetO/TetS family tetracycline resistance ribosomal protection protein [Streptomyces sp. NBC_00237]